MYVFNVTCRLLGFGWLGSVLGSGFAALSLSPSAAFSPTPPLFRIQNTRHYINIYNRYSIAPTVSHSFAVMARTRSQGISPNAPLRLLTPPRGTRGRRRAVRLTAAETAPTQSETVERIEPLTSTIEASDFLAESSQAAKMSPDLALQTTGLTTPATFGPKAPAALAKSPRRSNSDISHERIRPERRVSPMTNHAKRLREAPEENEENFEPSAKRGCPEITPSAPATPQGRLPRVNLLDSVSRGVGSVLSRLFKTPKPQDTKPTILSSSIDGDAGDLSSTLDLTPGSPSFVADHQRPPLFPIHNNTSRQVREQSRTTQRLTPHQIVAMEPNYIRKSQDEIEENLRKLRYPDEPWLQDPEEIGDDIESHQITRPFTPASSAPPSRKRKRVIPQGNYFERAYASSSEDEIEDRTSTQRSTEKDRPPRSALKQRSDAPDTVGRSGKRVKFTSPIEDLSNTVKAPRFGSSGLGSQNDFVDDDHSSFTDNSILNSTLANTYANTPRFASFITPTSRRNAGPVGLSFSEPPVAREFQPSVAQGSRRSFSEVSPNFSTPESPPIPATDMSSMAFDESSFVPQSHHPRPSTYCLPEEWSDESAATNETTMTAVDTSPSPAVTPSAVPYREEAAPIYEWDFGDPQTYAQAGVLTQEVIDLVNKNWIEEDSEDAGMFFQRDFTKYCRQIDEYEAKGFQIEIDC